jgi:MYXO-CTERM domain-containing protein
MCAHTTITGCGIIDAGPDAMPDARPDAMPDARVDAHIDAGSPHDATTIDGHADGMTENPMADDGDMHQPAKNTCGCTVGGRAPTPLAPYALAILFAAAFLSRRRNKR